MEGKNQITCNSFTNDLFGSKDSSSTSNSIFGPSSKVFGRESMGHMVFEKMQDPVNYVCNSKSGAPGNKEMGNEKQEKKESPFLLFEEKMQPCHLCSSIYYGGQDIFTSTQNSSYSSLKKDGGENDADIASRGNWWQGGLYY